MERLNVKNIMAFIIVILLYVLVPMLLFLLILLLIFGVFNLSQFIRTGDFSYGVNLIFIVIIGLGTLYLSIKLISWIKK